MASDQQRRELIRRNLGIRPINHGKIYTFQIAIPDSIKTELDFERKQLIENSLLEHQSNLVSLIVRRTEAYDDEDIEYELVAGEEWLQVAQELEEVETVWAWVFDLDDEQAERTRQEFKDLEKGDDQPRSTNGTSETVETIEKLLDKKFGLISNQIRQTLTTASAKSFQELSEKVTQLKYQVDQLSPEIEVMAKSIQEIHDEMFPPQLNLNTATTQQIIDHLGENGIQSNYSELAAQAVEYWKNHESGLSWEHLNKSTQSSSEHKISGFGSGTYKKMKKFCKI